MTDFLKIYIFGQKDSQVLRIKLCRLKIKTFPAKLKICFLPKQRNRNKYMDCLLNPV